MHVGTFMPPMCMIALPSSDVGPTACGAVAEVGASPVSTLGKTCTNVGHMRGLVWSRCLGDPLHWDLLWVILGNQVEPTGACFGVSCRASEAVPYLYGCTE